MAWSTVFGVIAAIILVVFANPIVSLFGTDTEMIDLAGKALRLNAILFITFGFQMVYATLSSFSLWFLYCPVCLA